MSKSSEYRRPVRKNKGSKGTAGLSAAELAKRNHRKNAQIHTAIRQFLAEAADGKPGVGGDRISPSRFRNMCKRDSALLEQTLSNLSDQDRRTIEKILG